MLTPWMTVTCRCTHLRAIRTGYSPQDSVISYVCPPNNDPDRKRATYAYRQFVRQGRGVDVWDKLQAGLLLGSDRFVDRLRPLMKDKPLDPEYRKCEQFATRPSLQQLFVDVTDKTTRNEQIYQAVRVHLMPWLRSTLAVCFHPVRAFLGALCVFARG